MKKSNFINIEKLYIGGVKNQLLTVQGVIKGEHSNIIIEVDGDRFKFDSAIKMINDTFLINLPLKKDSREIKIYLEVKNNKEFVISLKNNYLKRLIRRCRDVFIKFFLKIKLFFIIIYKSNKKLWKKHRFLVPPKLWKKYIRSFINKVNKNSFNVFYDPVIKNNYKKWLSENKTKSSYEKLQYNPLISILIPVYNIDSNYLSECIESVLNQSYENFEICLVDDCSTKMETLNTLKEFENRDKRIKIKYRKTNGHISKATNDALKMSKGEFIALLDNDDLLIKDALYEIVKVLNKDKKIDFIYSDEDKIDENGNRCFPHFKPDFSPDTLLSLNYICHFAVLRKSIVDEIKGFTVGLEGAQDYDLFLRFTEKTDRIYHIPKVLYHWRMVEGSTSMDIDNKAYANDKGKLVIELALKRRRIKARVEKHIESTYYRVFYEYEEEPKISIIIPTRDYPEILKVCIDSIYERTEYKNFEIIVVNNNSKKQETFDLFDEYKKKNKNFKVLDANIEFNYSKINNNAIKKAKGDYIVLLNNDTEIISNDWLKTMVGYAMQPHIGAVGAKLLYPDQTIQHAGVILGLGGVASHAYIGAHRNDLGIYGRLSVPYNYSAVTAACLMISKKKFNEVNGLEEDLMVAYNDIDFNIKLLEKGYFNLFVPQVELFHHESKSRGLDTTGKKYERFLKESNYMYKKWDKKLKNDKFYNPHFSKKWWFVLNKKRS